MKKIACGTLAAALLVAAGTVEAAPGIADCRAVKPFDERISICSAVIAAASTPTAERAEALRRRGGAHAERGAYGDAIADYTEALRFTPDSSPAIIGRAEARFAAGDVDGAVLDYGEALRMSGRSAGLLVARGYALLTKGDTAGAIADFTAAIADQPSHAGAYNNRGLAYRKQGDNGAALADYTAAIRINPAFAQAYANRGYVHESLGDKLAAVADLEHALQLDPTLTGAAQGLKRLGQPAALTAQSESLVANGRQLAQKNCAWCHAIEKTGDSPNPRAPRWRDLVTRNPMLAMRQPLTRGIVRPHDEMPAFELSDAETDTIIAYINSLAH